MLRAPVENAGSAGALACTIAKRSEQGGYFTSWQDSLTAERFGIVAGYLPHFDGKCEVQFITFRLSDSLPKDVLSRWRAELTRGEITDADFRKRAEHYLDQGYGTCWLNVPAVAATLQETLLKWDNKKYRLISWVIMPNHAHILIKLLDENLLSEIMHSIKSYTAHESNRLLGRTGRFWFVESFDRYIRDAKHYGNVIRYIENNPVKARLCKRPEDWEFSSAYGTSHREA